MTIPVKKQTSGKSKRKRMVRKQVYIYPQQEEQLKQLAEQRAVTEAELIREALEIMLSQSTISVKPLPSDELAWQEVLTFVDKRNVEEMPSEAYKWKREDGYDDERYRRPWAQPVAAIHSA